MRQTPLLLFNNKYIFRKIELMTQVSKYPLSKEVYERIFDIFLKSVTKYNSKKMNAVFLEELLTPTEQIMLAKRLAIGFLLIKEYDYRTISKILRVSTGTVNRVNLTIKNGKYFKLAIKRLIEDENISELLENVGDLITKVLAAGRSKSGSWVYLRNEIKKRKAEKIF